MTFVIYLVVAVVLMWPLTVWLERSMLPGESDAFEWAMHAFVGAAAAFMWPLALPFAASWLFWHVVERRKTSNPSNNQQPSGTQQGASE